MIDAETRQVIDLLPSRKQEEVSKWLKGFPSLKIVIRDGAAFFRNAVQEAHPDAIQVADRFHVLQALTRHAKKAIRSLLPKTLSNSVSKPRREKLTVSQKQKEKLIASVRELRVKGLTLSAIARQLDMDSRTVKRYIDPTIDCLEDHQNRVYTRELDKYAKQLPELLLRYQKLEDIYNELVKQGYSRSFFTFQKGYKIALATLKQENNQPAHIYRRPLIQLLFQEFEPDKLAVPIHEIFQQIPDVLEIIQAVHQFKAILKTTNFSALESWLTRIQLLDNKHLNAFVRGFSRDKEAILNTLKFPHLSNGLAEGKINKLKLIKRIMFGRGHFETLKKKVLLAN